MEGLNVLSLFDGMSCGMIALDRKGIKVKNYYASEVDKHAIKVSKHNWGDKIIHIGDVTKVSYSNGVLYTENGSYDVGKIDLLIGGSPCQDFSIANTMSSAYTEEGIGLMGSKSSLFYHYLRILNQVKNENSSVKWLLENVKMRKGCKEELDKYLGVEGKFINSSLVSFQSRPRYYWSNIEFEVPTDKQISFQDYKEVGNHCDQYKLKKTKSRLHMWSNGLGRNTENYGCANVTKADKIQCLTTKQDRCPNSGLVSADI